MDPGESMDSGATMNSIVQTEERLGCMKSFCVCLSNYALISRANYTLLFTFELICRNRCQIATMFYRMVFQFAGRRGDARTDPALKTRITTSSANILLFRSILRSLPVSAPASVRKTRFSRTVNDIYGSGVYKVC